MASIDGNCPKCGRADTYFVPLLVDGVFAGGEFQCYDCGYSEVYE